jgi:hypothetical protein
LLDSCDFDHVGKAYQPTIVIIYQSEIPKI